MKDKFKGLVVGLCLGSLIASSVAYASGSQIEVYFKQLKYMFDGVEKKPTQGQGFIYDGTTYVPLRFVGEALGKEVHWDDANQTVWIGEQKIADPVAVYKDGTISQAEYDNFLAIMQLYNPAYSSSLTDPAFKKSMLNQEITNKIIAERGRALDAISYKDIAAQHLSQLKQDFAKAYSGQITWEQRISNLKLTDAIIQDNIEQSLYDNVFWKSHITDSSLRDDYMKKLQNHEYNLATVSHILIALKPAGGTERTKEEALKIANEVIMKLKNGEDFAALAKQYSDDAGSKDNGGQYVKANVNGWIPEFKQAVVSLPLNQISEPVLTQFGYHIIRVDARSTATFEEQKDALSEPYIAKEYQDFTAKELPGLIISTNLK
jgi:foldase protein PrsA